MGVWVLGLVMALNGSVAGKVVDAKGAPVPAAAVRLTAAAGGPSFDTVTELDGTFAFAEAPSGSCTLSIEMAGFQKVALQVDPAADGATRLALTLVRVSSRAPSRARSRLPAHSRGPARDKAHDPHSRKSRCPPRMPRRPRPARP